MTQLIESPISTKLAEILTGYKEELLSFRSLLDACPLPMFLTNPGGLVMYVNTAYLNLLGAKLEDVQGSGWLNFILAEDRPQFQETWETSINSGMERFDVKARYVKIDGSVVEASTRVCRIFHENYSGFIIQPYSS